MVAVHKVFEFLRRHWIQSFFFFFYARPGILPVFSSSKQIPGRVHRRDEKGFHRLRAASLAGDPGYDLLFLLGESFATKACLQSEWWTYRVRVGIDTYAFLSVCVVGLEFMERRCGPCRGPCPFG